MRLIEQTPLAGIRQLPTDCFAREMPPLIQEILDAALRTEREPDLGTQEDLARRVQAVVALRHSQGDPGPEPIQDIAALEAVLLGALKRELRDAPVALVDAIERLTRLSAAAQTLALEELLRHRSSELEWLAHTDALTGLFNLRYLQQQVDYLLGLQQRYGHPFALLLLDVDGLKRVNDSYGHAAGDQLLVGVADAVRATTRSVDVPARIGGDEFCVLAPHQTAARAGLLAERLALAIESVETADGAGAAVSIGVVSCPEHSTDAARLLALADAAMYRAKAAGSRVAQAQVDPEPQPEPEPNNHR